jgi:hypothetical protein
MFKFNLQINGQNAIRALGASAKAIKFCSVDGINDTAEGLQKYQQKRLTKVFTVKSPKSKAFLEKNIAVIKPFAKLNSKIPFAEVSTSYKERLLLNLFETGGVQTPKIGKNVAVPLVGQGKARPSKNSPVANAFYISKMNLQKYKGQVQSKILASVDKKGKLKTKTKGFFVIPNVGIFQRKGGKMVEVYTFRKRVKIKRMLDWQRSSKLYITLNLSKNIIARYVKYVAKGRGR